MFTANYWALYTVFLLFALVGITEYQIYAETHEPIPETLRGHNYDAILLEDYGNGHGLYKYDIQQYDRVLSENYWNDFVFSETDEYVRFESTSVSFEFYKDTCDFKLYPIGMIGNNAPLIDSISSVVKRAPDGSDTWQDMNHNSCNTLVTEIDQGIQINATLSDNFVDYVKVFNLDFDDGLETFHVIKNNNLLMPNEKFGVTTICDGCNDIEIDGKKQNGKAFLKEDLIEKKLKINGYRVDLKNEQHDMLHAFKNENGKTIVDFTDSKGKLGVGNQIIIDPTFDLSDGDNISTSTSVSTSDPCPVGTGYGIDPDPPFIQKPDTVNNDRCYQAVIEFDISSVTGTTVDSVIFEYDIELTGAGIADATASCDFNSWDRADDLSTEAGSALDVWNAQRTGTSFVDNEVNCATVATGYSSDFGANGVADMQTAIDASATVWAFSMALDDLNKDGDDTSVRATNINLEIITSSGAPPPNAIDVLVIRAINKTALDFDWDALATWQLQGGNVTGYQITYTTPAGAPQTVFNNDTGSTDTQIDVTGLVACTEYSGRVSVWTEVGNNATGAITNATTSCFDPPDAPTLTAIALGDTSLRFTRVAGASSGDNVTAWYGLQCELNGVGGWLSTVLNSTIPLDNLYEYTGLTVGDDLICQWRDGSSAGWSDWSNNATAELVLLVIHTERSSTFDPIKDLEAMADTYGGFFFGLSLFPFFVMLVGFMATPKTTGIFTLITLMLMGILHGSGYYVYPDWFWALMFLFGIPLILGRKRTE